MPSIEWIEMKLEGASERDWVEALGKATEDLELLNHNTEQDFLKIGGKLADFIGAVNAISSELASLARLISGADGAGAYDVLTGALDRSLAMEERRVNGGALANLRRDASQLRKTLVEYERTVANFRAIGVLTRIEIARLGERAGDFENLTRDVSDLSENVAARVQRALDATATLIPAIEKATQDISILDEEQARDLPSLISAVAANLSSLREIQDRTHAASVRLGERYAAISDAFGKLIVSIQFHDITRQQVEHVIGVLRRLCSESRNADQPDNSGQSQNAVVLALQSLQLANAAEKFTGSTESLSQSLADLAANVLLIAEESRTLFSDSGGEGDSFLRNLETGCAAILGRLSQCANTDEATRAANRMMTETICEMREPVEEIREIEGKMFHVSLNARISATHLGDSGAPLDVLADSIGRQSLDSRQRSESLVKDLDSMNAVVTRFSEAGGPGNAGERGTDIDYSTQMRIAIAELRSCRERSSSGIPQVIESSHRLHENLTETRAEFSTGVFFAETIRRVRAVLDDIGVEQGGLTGKGELSGQGVLERGLETLAVNYTMQSQRDIHESILGVGTAVGGAGESDDNIEFF